LYALYDEVFLANPGFDWQNKTFDPVQGQSVEAGIKRNWLNGKWNMVIAAYQITRNNVLTTDTEHAHPVSGQFVYSRQTGQQQTQGIEFDVKGSVLKNLDVIINYAYTDAKITRDSDPEVIGNQVAGATSHIQNTWLTYRIPLKNDKTIRIMGGYQYQAGRSSWYIFDNTEAALPDYVRVDGGISYTSGSFHLSLNVNNILDEYLYSGAPYGDMYYWQTEAGRNYRLTVGYKF
jgi:iron complex outermembrane receptor protein